ncbi:hypothetical protein [Escherichia phage vB_EcoM_JNE01]|nr:hypothetical protein [Escherichia phage vB_EcoM_JNE01]
MTNTNSNTYFRYLRLGLSLRPIRGKCDSLADLDYAYALHCDGVQYVLGDFGTFEETNDSTELKTGIDNLNLITNSSRHDIVLEIQNFIEQNTGKRTWSYVGTDTQLSVAFGNDEGYVAQLIMDFENEEKFLEFKDKIMQSLIHMGIQEENMPEIKDIEEFVLIPSDEKYDAMFTNLKVPGVIVEFFDDGDDSIYIDLDDDGDDDE